VRTLFVTGATGFVGAALTLELLRAHPRDRALCLVRGADGDRRLSQALRAAAAAYDVPEAAAEDAIGRAGAVAGDVTTAGLGLGAEGRAALAGRSPLHVFHVAASLKDSDDAMAEIFDHNIAGTERVLDALAGTDVAAFNYVSTAYVAGSRIGAIAESLAAPPAFNNRYEESKHRAEELVVARCSAAGVPWRLLRPAIVVGHSRTGRATGHTGFLGWVQKLAALHEASGGALRQKRLRYVARGDARLNVIPIDSIVEDTLAIDAAGAATLGRVFHLTNREAPEVGWLIETIAGALRIVAPEVVGPDAELDSLSRRFHKWTRFERSYVHATRDFARDGDALYASPRQGRVPLDADLVRRMVVGAVADFARSRGAADATATAAS